MIPRVMGLPKLPLAALAVAVLGALLGGCGSPAATGADASPIADMTPPRDATRQYDMACQAGSENCQIGFDCSPCCTAIYKHAGVSCDPFGTPQCSYGEFDSCWCDRQQGDNGYVIHCVFGGFPDMSWPADLVH